MPTSKKPGNTRKLIAFDQETWRALDLLARDSMKSIQELADEAFRDLLQKHGRPSDLKAALRQSAQQPRRRAQALRAAASRGVRRSCRRGQVFGGGAKKQRRVPSGRLQRQ